MSTSRGNERRRLRSSQDHGQQVRNGSLTGRDLQNDTVTGRDVQGLTKADFTPESLDGDVIDEDGLGVVPHAKDACFAARLGSIRPEEVLTVPGCQDGKVRGAVRVHTAEGSLPATYTQDQTWVSSPQIAPAAPCRYAATAQAGTS